ncbi:MAG TPA: N-acetylglucosamine-6-phosphate deacetylase [Mobilitalea sp.]|nr:N-acetylglucosamine-6-phosphate deacetylase [Mobilitalea sp.]
MIIRNAKVYNDEGRFILQDIYMEGEVFTAAEDYQGSKRSFGEVVLDAAGLMAIPGLTDIHFHGCVNYDLCNGTEEAISAIAEYELQNGITTICPASMTLPEEVLTKIVEAVSSYDNTKGADLVGINLEGPFISTEKKGAQNELYIVPPNLELYRRLQKVSKNRIKLVDIAPEEPGALEFIKAVKDEVVVSLAHTAADYETATKALQAGASHITHLYNAMPAYTHRKPGVIGAASDSPDCTVELIGDGVHVHPAVVRNTFRIFGSDRVILVSDSLMATGIGDGEVELGGQKVYVKGKKATLKDGTLAGSVMNLMDCVRVCVKEIGIPLEQAVRSAAVNSAKAIGIYDKYGSITPGKYANVVLLDEELNVRGVIKKGRLVK